MSDRVQVGVEVDAELWEELRNDVRERKGKVRGVLGDELDNAIQHYLYNGPDRSTPQQLNDIEARLNRIEGAVGVEATDGGLDTSTTAEDTHTPDQSDNDKPHQNTGRKKKIEWLAAEYRRQYANDNDTLYKATAGNVKDLIDEEYAFAEEERTANYVSDVLDELGMVQHPKWDHRHVTEERYQEIVEEMEADE